MKPKSLYFNIFPILLLLAACAQQATTMTPTPAPTSTIAPTPTDTPPIPTPIPSETITKIDEAIQNLVDQDLFTGSILVGQHGNILLSQGYGLADRAQKIPNTAQTRFRIGSITKQFTAMATLILESQNKLRVNDPICNYFEDCPSAWEKITIEHLILHTSGIHDFVDETRYQDPKDIPTDPEQIIAGFKDLPLDFQPGKQWSYSNAGYDMLGYVIEKVSGQSYEAFLQQSIFTPLGMKNTGFAHNADGLAVGYKDAYAQIYDQEIDRLILYSEGGLYSTTEDLYRWGQALSSNELLPAEYMEKMFAPSAKIPMSMTSGKEVAYGYGWLIWKENGRSSVWHNGELPGFTSIITMYPKEQVTIIVLCNQTKAVEVIHSLIARVLFRDQ
jgi:CubicO group peptidase (beta-lactamase class C family)